jgi:signal transduction histidine kinase
MYTEHMRRLTAFLLIWMGWSVLGFAQLPVIRSYAPQEYHAGERNWQFTQSAEGYLYVANDEGLLVYDGARWRLIEVPGRTVRALGTDRQGHVFVGTKTDFGYIETDPQGREHYASLRNRLPDSTQIIGTIFDLSVGAEAVFLESQTAILRIDLTDPTWPVTRYPISEYIIGTQLIHGTYYVVGEEHLYAFRGQQFRRIRSVTLNLEDYIFGLASVGEQGALAFTDQNHILYFENGLEGDYQLWNTELDRYIRQNNLSLYFGFCEQNRGMRQFEENIYAFPTVDGGVLITDEQGNLQHHITSDRGLSSNSVYDAYFDNEGSLWLATNRGLSKLLFTLPLRKFSGPDGLEPPVLSVLPAGSTLYAGTHHGLFLQRNREEPFQFIPETDAQIWQLKSWRGGVLAASGNKGVMFVEGDRLMHQFRTEVATMSVLTPNDADDLVFAGLYNGFQILRYTEQGFRSLYSSEEIRGVVRSQVYDAPRRTLWLGTDDSGLYRLRFSADENGRLDYAHPEVTHLNQLSGISLREHNQVVGRDSLLWVTGVNRLYRLDPADMTLRVDTLCYTSWFGAYPNLKQDLYGRVWIKNRKRVVSQTPGLASEVDSLALISLESRMYDIALVNRNLAWIAASDGLYRKELQAKDIMPVQRLAYRSVSVAGKEQPLNSESNPTGYEWPYKSGNMEFELASPTYQQEEQLRYRFRLDGLQDTWSPWSDEASYEIGYVPEGSYTLHAEVTDLIGTKVAAAPLAFTIDAPWYRTPWSYGLYLMGIGFLIWGFSSYRNQRLIRRSEYLSQLVAARTEYITQKNEELHHQTEELRRANELKTQFMNMAVHDLRNPLAVIVGLTDLLRHDGHDEKTRVDYLTQIERVANRMLNRVNRVLTDSKTTGELDTDQLVPVEINGVIREVVTRCRILADRKGQTLDVDFGALSEVMGNPEILADVFENVVGNAIKYGPKQSSVKVSVSRVSNQSSPQEWVQVVVSDNGPGIPPEEHAEVFKAYYTSTTKPTGDEHSTGLGLYIVRSVLLKLGGSVTILSDPEKRPGTTIQMRLPAI